MEETTHVLASWAPTPTTHAIRVERPTGFTFKAGQHVILELDTADGVDDRFLSITSGPAEDHLAFAVRVSDSAFKQAFAELDKRDELLLMGPSGRFHLDESAPAVFLSGGIGITPIKSMIAHATHARSKQDLVLLYGNRSPDEIVFRAEIDALAAANPKLTIGYTVDAAEDEPDWSGRVGHVDARMLHELTDHLDDAVYYTCGPPGMVGAMQRLLADAGVDRARVRTENFTGY